MDEHAFPSTGFAVAWLGCSLQYVQLSSVIAKLFGDTVIFILLYNSEKQKANQRSLVFAKKIVKDH